MPLVILFLLFIANINSIVNGYKSFNDGISQIHMAQGKNYSTMTISWLSDCTGSSIVKYGIKQNNMSYISHGYDITYSFTYYDNPKYTSKYIHHVELKGLEPSTTYHYQCSCYNIVSETNYFITGTEPGDSIVYSFGIIGDIGQTSDTELTLNHMRLNRDVQTILHAGDLSYADCNQTLWDTYGELTENLSKTVSWMVGPGNHEIEFYEYSGSNQTLFLAYESRYKMPSIKPPEYGDIIIDSSINPRSQQPYCTPSVFLAEYDYGNSFYSFEIGLSHIIYLNPYTRSDKDSNQYKWFLDDISNINRIRTPWIIIVMHCPWYSSNKAHQAEIQAVLMRENMEVLFFQYGVNIVFTGHVHAYERTYPVYKDEIQTNAPVYITIGDGGNIEGHANEYYEKPKWSAFRNGTDYGYGTMTILNKNKLLWRWYRNEDRQYVFRDGILLDNHIF